MRKNRSFGTFYRPKSVFGIKKRMSTPTPSSEEWIRLPRPKERCPVTGLSRTSLVEILDEKDPATGELCVKQYRKERHGKQRRIRLIHRESLLAFLDRRALAQNALRFAAHVNNPNNETVETVLKNFDLFELFLGEDNGVTNFDWEEGRLSTRAARIQALRDLGIIEGPG